MRKQSKWPKLFLLKSVASRTFRFKLQTHCVRTSFLKHEIYHEIVISNMVPLSIYTSSSIFNVQESHMITFTHSTFLKWPTTLLLNNRNSEHASLTILLLFSDDWHVSESNSILHRLNIDFQLSGTTYSKDEIPVTADSICNVWWVIFYRFLWKI